MKWFGGASVLFYLRGSRPQSVSTTTETIGCALIAFPFFDIFSIPRLVLAVRRMWLCAACAYVTFFVQLLSSELRGLRGQSEDQRQGKGPSVEPGSVDEVTVRQRQAKVRELNDWHHATQRQNI